MLHDIRYYMNRDYFRVGERDFYLRFFICRRTNHLVYGLGQRNPYYLSKTCLPATGKKSKLIYHIIERAGASVKRTAILF